MLVCLGACTYCAGSDVLFDHLSKSRPSLVVGVDLTTFLLLSGQMCHPQGAGRYLSGFGADPVFLRVFQGVFQLAGMGCGGAQLLWCEQWMDVGGCGAWSRSQVDI